MALNIIYITLPSGEILEGKSFGACMDKPIRKEIVIYTRIRAYDNILDDSSYNGQILLITGRICDNSPNISLPDTFKPLVLIVDNFSSDLVNKLEKNNIVGIYGIDIKYLVGKIRDDKIVDVVISNDKSNDSMEIDIPKIIFPNVDDKIRIYNSTKSINTLVVNCGIKNSVLKELLKRDTKVTIVPHTYDFSNDIYDRLFISNGPGNPKDYEITINTLKKVLRSDKFKNPIFGVSLGHQLLALAIGADTYKMPYSNTGDNIPCILNNTDNCYITSQNHSYAVNNDSIPYEDGWDVLFSNINDNSNEGIIHNKYPYFSVQFNPEDSSDVNGTNFLFDIFINNAVELLRYKERKDRQVNIKNYNKVLILGSGGFTIGKSGKLDCLGSQVIKSFRDKGLATVLIDPNISSVQTTHEFVDKVYYLPITPDYVESVIEQEHPDCILLSLGGNTSFECGVQLDKLGILEKYNISILGTPIDSVINTKDKYLLGKTLKCIDEEVPCSIISDNRDSLLKFTKEVGYPVLLKGSESVNIFIRDDKEYVKCIDKMLSISGLTRITVTKSIAELGLKEFEYIIIRDKYNNCVVVCDMECMDPIGVHINDSVIVVPSQTLSDNEYNILKCVSIKIARYLNIIGGCSIRFALNPLSGEYYVTCVNTLLSDLPAIASRATCYPIAYISAKLYLGYALHELKNDMTGISSLCEPILDYYVVKIPIWDLSKFSNVDASIGICTKSVGEVMGIGKTFEEAFQKALRSAHGYDISGLNPYKTECTNDTLSKPTIMRIFAIANGLYTGLYNTEKISELSGIDIWFINKFNNIISFQKRIETSLLTEEILLDAKRLGFSDKYIAKCCKSTELLIRKERKRHNIYPYVKQIDNVCGKYECNKVFLYYTYSAYRHDVEFLEDMVIILGSGGYKLGNGSEFDWGTVNCSREVRKIGKNVIVINNNPEAVSTDYRESDRLYFEELSLESIMNIYELEKSYGIILSVGGQLSNNIATQLNHQKVNILGTSSDMIDNAENRYKFSRMLDSINIDQPEWRDLTSKDNAIQFCDSIGYPCLIRPSYVLSGIDMNVTYDEKDLESYLCDVIDISKDHPVVISKYITDSKEIEVDAVACHGKVIVMSIAENVENAGIHSGDSTLILPPHDITKDTMDKIKLDTHKIAKSLNINGPFNIQFIAKDDMIKVIECNLRMSRTFPFVSKTLGTNFVEIATRVMMGLTPKSIDTDTLLNTDKYGVKVPLYPFEKLCNTDIKLGVEMISTGDVACFGINHYDAFIKAFISSGYTIPIKGVLLSIGSYRYKRELLESVKLLSNIGYSLYGTTGTADFYRENGIKIEELVCKKGTKHSVKNNIDKFDLFINISKPHKILQSNNSKGYRLRRYVMDNNICIITDIKKAKLLIKSISVGLYPKINTQIDCFTSYDIIRIPGLIDVHVHVREPGATYKEDWESCTKAALAGGITLICAMPNTDPPIINEKSFNDVLETANRKAHCDFGIYVGANSHNYNEIYKLSDRAAALKMYLNNTYGPLLLEETTDWIEHVQNWPENRPLCVHAESKTLPAILHICNLYNKRVHVCHVARKEEIEVIKVSKLQGMKITCEVAPHHLFLDRSVCGHLDENMIEVKPPIVHKVDRQALWDNIGIIDCFATDHAPHTIDDKKRLKHPGFPGLETALPLLLTAVKQGKLTIDDIVEKYYTNPKKIFDLPDQPDTYVEIAMNHEWTVPESMKYSKCGWTPFVGMKVYGTIKRTVLRGKVVFVDGEILTEPGYGENIRKLPSTNINKNNNLPKNIQNLPKEMSTKKYKNHILLKNVYSVGQFTRDILRDVFSKTTFYKNSKEIPKILKGKTVSSIFCESSTRTKTSFDVALRKLGGHTIHIDMPSSSSNNNNNDDSLEDFLKCMECYADCILLRLASPINYKNIIDNINIPIINCGDGFDEHPTQALLDLYTIREEIGTVTGKTITFVGDLKNCRAVHSLIKLLCLYKNVRICYIPANGLEIPDKIKSFVDENNIEQVEHISSKNIINSIIGTTDVLYMTRIPNDTDNVDDIMLTPDKIAYAKENMAIMHPFPRNNEIHKDIDNDPRAAYFRQMKNGLFVRMALLDMLMDRE